VAEEAGASCGGDLIIADTEGRKIAHCEKIGQRESEDSG
jgi:hypothetical protein